MWYYVFLSLLFIMLSKIVFFTFALYALIFGRITDAFAVFCFFAVWARAKKVNTLKD